MGRQDSEQLGDLLEVYELCLLLVFAAVTAPQAERSPRWAGAAADKIARIRGTRDSLLQFWPPPERETFSRPAGSLDPAAGPSQQTDDIAAIPCLDRPERHARLLISQLQNDADDAVTIPGCVPAQRERRRGRAAYLIYFLITWSLGKWLELTGWDLWILRTRVAAGVGCRRDRGGIRVRRRAMIRRGRRRHRCRDCRRARATRVVPFGEEHGRPASYRW